MQGGGRLGEFVGKYRDDLLRTGLILGAASAAYEREGQDELAKSYRVAATAMTTLLRNTGLPAPTMEELDRLGGSDEGELSEKVSAQWRSIIAAKIVVDLVATATDDSTVRAFMDITSKTLSRLEALAASYASSN